MKSLHKWSLALWLLGCPLGAIAEPPPGECPQPRFTGKAPDDIYARKDPLDPTPDRIAEGRSLYEKGTRPPCQVCHGIEGDGKGPMATQFEPRPRNFRCTQTINGIPDGQLFWIIRNGSPGTGMPPHKTLSDEQIWHVVLYLRALAQAGR